MYVFSLTKRKLKRVIYSSALIIIGVVIGVYAVVSCINVGAAGDVLPIY